MALSGNIRAARIRRGLTQRELAECVGVNRSTVSAWEQGRSVPRYDHIDALALALYCSIDTLRFGAGNTSGRMRRSAKRVRMGELRDAVIMVLTKCPSLTLEASKVLRKIDTAQPEAQNMADKLIASALMAADMPAEHKELLHGLQ